MSEVVEVSDEITRVATRIAEMLCDGTSSHNPRQWAVREWISTHEEWCTAGEGTVLLCCRFDRIIDILRAEF